MMKERQMIAFYEAFDWRGVWFGTGTREAIRKANLMADFRYPMFGPASLAINGWACKAKCAKP